MARFSVIFLVTYFVISCTSVIGRQLAQYSGGSGTGGTGTGTGYGTGGTGTGGTGTGTGYGTGGTSGTGTGTGTGTGSTGTGTGTGTGYGTGSTGTGTTLQACCAPYSSTYSVLVIPLAEQECLTLGQDQGSGSLATTNGYCLLPIQDTSECQAPVADSTTTLEVTECTQEITTAVDQDIQEAVNSPNTPTTPGSGTDTPSGYGGAYAPPETGNNTPSGYGGGAYNTPPATRGETPPMSGTSGFG